MDAAGNGGGVPGRLLTERSQMNHHQLLRRLRSVRDMCVSMASHAQTIRIQQVQAASAAGLSPDGNADDAWESIRRLREAVDTELQSIAAEHEAAEEARHG